MSTEPDTPLASCRLDPTTYEETLVQLSAGPNFGESIINNTPWNEQPESMQLPSDVTLGSTLDAIDDSNPNVENGYSRKSLYQYVLDLGQRPSCKFTEADRKSLASGLINGIFPGGNLPDLMKHVEHVVGVEPADTLDPLHFQDDLPDINTNVLVRTEEGRVGYVQQWQDYCSQPTCADRLFRDGQNVVLNEYRQWTHADADQTECVAAPLTKIPPSCEGCVEPLTGLILSTVFAQSPVHLSVKPEGSLVTCASGTSMEDFRRLLVEVVRDGIWKGARRRRLFHVNKIFSESQ